MNKLHIAGTGLTSGAVVEGINLFFTHALTPDQSVYLVSILPVVVMTILAVVQAAWPKTKPVVAVIEQSIEPTKP